MEDDIFEAAALILAFRGVKVGTVIRASANVNKRLSHFKEAMGNRRN